VNWVDFTVFFLYWLSSGCAVFRGFFREVFSLVGLVVGLMVAAT
jgi:uncharacterized membrane protein required for colicin V production